MSLSLTFFPALRISKVHYVKVTGAKAFFDPHILTEPLLVGNYEVLCRTSPHMLLCHLEEEVTRRALQESLGLQSRCVVLPADTGVVEDLHEDQVLQV